MNTNFQMVIQLDKKYIPERKGYANGEEVKLIRNTLCITEMDVLQLRNLRDFVVLYYSQESDKNNDRFWTDRDKMSSIVSVIDLQLLNLGEEV